MGELSLCCSGCKGKNGNSAGDPCAYCFSDDDCYKTVQVGKRDDLDIDFFNNGTRDYVDGLVPRDTPHSEQVDNVKDFIADEPCPPDYSKRGYGPDNPYEQSVWWTFQDGKQDQWVPYDIIYESSSLTHR